MFAGKAYYQSLMNNEQERMKQLVKNLQVSLGERIEAQTWMSAETKKNALDKLNSF